MYSLLMCSTGAEECGCLPEILCIHLHIAESGERKNNCANLCFLRCLVFLKIADLLKEMKAERCPGVLSFGRKLHQAAHFTCKVLLQSRFHQGTHLDVKGLEVRRIEVNAVLKTVTQK